MLANEAFIDRLIANHHRAVRYHLLFALGLVGIGIAVIIGAILLSGRLIPDAFSGLFGVGGAFTSSLSAFQVKEILARREKAEIFKAIKARLHELDQAQSSMDTKTRKRIDDLLWQIVEKTALG